ncbi:hypothetical protein MycrhDRAFT_5777 [Mycolicibacterium rhodesiae JS60]|nr:hypothetical protein MycrhDRAFT_5777 [Mycolicibacterium rhodesiae JS60]
MIYTLTNETDDLFEKGLVRVVFDVDHELALEILAAAKSLKATRDKEQSDALLKAMMSHLYVSPGYL